MGATEAVKKAHERRGGVVAVAAILFVSGRDVSGWLSVGQSVSVSVSLACLLVALPVKLSVILPDLSCYLPACPPTMPVLMCSCAMWV